MNQSSSRVIKGQSSDQNNILSGITLPEFAKPASEPGVSGVQLTALPDFVPHSAGQSGDAVPHTVSLKQTPFHRTPVLRGAQMSSMVNGWAVPVLKTSRTGMERKSTQTKPEEFTSLLAEAQAQSDEILAEAREAAKKILADAKKEADKLRQQGFMEGMNAAKSEAAESMKQVGRVFQELQLWQEQVMRQSQGRIMGMIVEIGRKLFGDGFELPAELLDHIVSRAINEASRLGNLRIYLHPEDAKILVSLWQESEILVNGQQIQIISSQNISRGGCFVDGQFGIVDGRVEEQIDQIAESLRPEVTTELDVEEL